NILSNSQTLQFVSPGYSASELGGGITITVLRKGPPTGTVSVLASTSGGTATPNVDYVPVVNQPLVFDPGVTARTFRVTLLPDAAIDGNETRNLILGGASGAGLGTPRSAVLTLLSANPGVQFGAAAYAVPQTASQAVIGVQRTRSLAGTVKVDWKTQDGTAHGGTDYIAATGTLTFPPGVA